MARHKHSFFLEVSSSEIYLAPIELLDKYDYHSDADIVPEIELKKGRYEVVMEVLKTSRGDLRTSGILEVKGKLAVGDFTYVLSNEGMDKFDRAQKTSIMRGSIRECLSIYTGREGDFSTVVTLTKI